MTQRTQTDWSGSSLPPTDKDLVWKSVDDFTMNISFGTNKYTGARDFTDLDKTDTVFSMQTSVPSWMVF